MAKKSSKSTPTKVRGFPAAVVDNSDARMLPGAGGGSDKRIAAQEVPFSGVAKPTV